MKDNQEDIKMYVCKQCGPMCRVMREVWQPGTDSAIELEFINQSERKMELAFKITFPGKKIDKEKPLLMYARCGVCDAYLGKERALSKQFLDDFELHFEDGLKRLEEDIKN